jgi:RNA polymerase sigma-70 factor, ECF subfamily
VSDLEAVFRDAIVGTNLDDIVARTPPTDLTPRLAALCSRGRAAFSTLDLDDGLFIRHLARCAVAGPEGPVPLEELAIEDLYLACACIEGVAGAAEAFEARCAGPIRAVLATFTRVASEQEDIGQLVRMAVLVGDRGVSRKIESYQGRGPLGRWIGVVAQRIALSVLRADEHRARALDLDDLQIALDWRDPGIALIKERYRPAFRQALEDALGKLGQRPRVLLRLNLVDGVSTVRLAKMFGVTQPTASRWLIQARENVADEMRRLLAERMSLSPADIESLAGLVISQIDLSLSMLLASK